MQEQQQDPRAEVANVPAARGCLDDVRQARRALRELIEG